ncbi:MAG: ABC transporter ATP-binding protein [Devosia sp.]|uniref:ATP-binding cassette domain-containing protein n=1 Tax=Devosia sp. TaxID=1871048 RepID=UPI0024CD98D8|nr:ABC transporter ATP-binding protein [Devosia sp.]UYO01195.1 MAG: ABC transporter ATP-binding protein [Devosia sp.]
MTVTLDIENLTMRYGDVVAVDGLSLRLEGVGICGLLGRNGSGKTTLLSAVAGLRRPDGGQVLVDGLPVFDNEAATSQICLIRESGDMVDGTETIGYALEFSADMRPYWSEALAGRLLDTFKLDRKKKVGTLSRGQRSALASALGLASQAPLTLFDEAYLGMDAPTRYAFYEALLADYMDNPRIIVLSTHLIEEVARLFSDIVIIDAGRMVLREDAETLQARGATLVGPREAVDRATEGLRVLSTRDLGPTRSVAVFGEMARITERAAAERLDVGGLPIQDIFVHITAEGSQP